MPSASRIKFALLENAVDFVSVGIEIFFSESETVKVAAEFPYVGGADFFKKTAIEVERELNTIYREESRRLKHSLINVFAGILLLMKERLRMIHPNLIYSDVGKRPKQSHSTINFDDILSRVENWVDPTIDFPRYARLLRRAQRERNKLEHYEFDAHPGVLRNLIPKLVEFAYLFAAKELDYDIRSALSPNVWAKFDSMKAVAAHLAEIEKAERQAIRRRYSEMTDEEIAELADVEPYHPKHNPEPIVLTQCPQCGEESLIFVVEDGVGVCTELSCRGVFELDYCVRCGASTIGEYCDDCEGYLEYLMDKD